MRKSLHIVSLQPIAVYIRNLISLSLSTLKQESFLSIFSAVSLHFLGSSLLQVKKFLRFSFRYLDSLPMNLIILLVS